MWSSGDQTLIDQMQGNTLPAILECFGSRGEYILRKVFLVLVFWISDLDSGSLATDYQYSGPRSGPYMQSMHFTLSCSF